MMWRCESHAPVGIRGSATDELLPALLATDSGGEGGSDGLMAAAMTLDKCSRLMKRR